ncbi:hypothetical protein ASPZODRAFT_127432 [Penicilliopsis zonata CBS 506.65]|uniref:Outer spore wall protein RRT8 n=1 Tax=Penicilliopsis zonata CBS 506.65 TaxID=1073090 RepID=A0A1L9SW46_9EURO|nr:hypothetical protein ASPZODRAFT_127432 [Penicilliopsis zonata CBS 506.65]OJJ51364.1 hypothetical protein ASPZODRAFT_127432 [Penicilliopsis zonata CBS 506.65]
MSTHIKAALADEASRLQSSAHQIAKSGAYLYPLKGIVYLLTHRNLWSPLVARAWQTLTLGAGITVLLFATTYIPQVALLAFTSGPLAPVSAALLVLSESSTLTNFFLTKSNASRVALGEVFDDTLLARGSGHLLDDREAKRDGKRMKIPSFSVPLVRSLVYLPLNFVPVVGTISYIVLQGRKIGPFAHARYFHLKGWRGDEVREWVEAHRGGYTGFGIAAFVLEMVPFASTIFTFTNTIGAAMWASDIERELSSR